MRPVSGVRYVLERASVEADHVAYEGFAHLPDADVPLSARVALPAGAVTVAPGVTDHPRAAELAKTGAALVRAATKAEVSAGRALPRKIARWRG